MKKVLLSALAVITFGAAAMAQVIDNRNDRRIPSKMDMANPFNHKPLGKGGNMVSDWYSIFDIIANSNVGTGLQPFVSFMTHDSLNKNVWSDGNISYGGPWVSVGQILDPKDDLIQLTTKPQNQLTRFNSYKIDSIGMVYLYVRNTDSIPDGMGGKKNVVDTLFIHYFSGSQIRKLQFTSTGNKLALVDWDYSKRMPANFTSVQTILLPGKVNPDLDTTRVSNNNGGFENGFGVKYMQFPAPAGLQITAAPDGSTINNLTGFTVTFKSAVPAVIGTDTAVMVYQKDPITMPAGMRRANFFGFRYQNNASGVRWSNPNYFNTTLEAPARYSYVDDGQPNSWKGFVSGNAYTQEDFLQAFFHLSVTGSIGAGVEEADQVSISKVYPNPASTSVRTTFETKSNANVKVELFDLLGHSVKSQDYGMVTAGTYNSNLDLTGLNPGIYLVQVTAGTSTTTQKLVIAE